MALTNCITDVIDEYSIADEREINIGADLFFGKDFYRPPVEDIYHQRMRPWKAEYLHFKSRNNVIMQFRLGEFRKIPCVIYTDTKNNTWYFFKNREAGYARTIKNTNINRASYHQRVGYLEKLWRKFREVVRSERLNLDVEEINKITDVLIKRRKLYAS